MSIYNNLKYKYTKNELKNIDKAWEVIYNFDISENIIGKYKDKIINYVNKDFNKKSFNIIEIIIEKMYWNMKEIVQTKYKENNIDYNIYINIDNDKKKEIILENKFLYNSYINKMSITENSITYIKKNNLPNSLSQKTDVEIETQYIMKHRDIYETILKVDNKIAYINELCDFNKNNFIVNFDFCFPNLNTIKPFIYSENEREYRIEKMYFSDNKWKELW